MFKKYILFNFLLLLTPYWLYAQTPIPTGVFTINGQTQIEVRIQPTSTYTSQTLTNIVVPLRWLSTESLTFGTFVTNTYSFSAPTTGTSGSYNYAIFEATPAATVTFNSGTEYSLFIINISSPTSAQSIELAPTSYASTLLGDKRWYMELGGTTYYDVDDSDGDNGFYTISAALPIELASFTSRLEQNKAVLRWETISETNNDGFEIEHATDAKTWQSIGFVEGKGTTTLAQQYRFEVKDLPVGTHYFRLKQKDFDGSFKYSDTVQVSAEVVGTHILTPAYPNPFNPQTKLSFAVATSQQVTMELYNMLGQRVVTLYKGKPVANDLQQIEINGATLPSGIYMVRLIGENFQQIQKITLVK